MLIFSIFFFKVFSILSKWFYLWIRMILVFFFFVLEFMFICPPPDCFKWGFYVFYFAKKVWKSFKYYIHHILIVINSYIIKKIIIYFLCCVIVNPFKKIKLVKRFYFKMKMRYNLLWKIIISLYYVCWWWL